ECRVIRAQGRTRMSESGRRSHRGAAGNQAIRVGYAEIDERARPVDAQYAGAQTESPVQRAVETGRRRSIRAKGNLAVWKVIGVGPAVDAASGQLRVLVGRRQLAAIIQCEYLRAPNAVVALSADAEDHRSTDRGRRPID